MMAEDLLLVFGTFSFLVISWLTWKILNLIWWKPKKIERYLRQQGIRGPPYRLFHGNVKENLHATKEAKSKPMDLSHHIAPRVIPFVHQTTQKYGKTHVIWFGTAARVQIMDPDIIKHVVSDKSGDFPKFTSSQLSLLLSGVASYEGEKWAKHRRITQQAFHLEKLKMMIPAFYASCAEMVSKWRKLVSEESRELDVWPEFRNLTGDVISRTAFGSSYEEGQRIFQLQTEHADLLIQGLLVGIHPRYLPTKRSKRTMKVGKEIRTLLTEIINKREKAMKVGATKSDDLLGFLMESNLKEMEGNQNSKKFEMSIDEVIAECKLFYFAGQETTAILLSWTMIVLSMHPEWQVKAREEVMQVFGKRKPDFDGLNQLKTVTMIFYEVLRLYPPVPTLLRKNRKTMKLGQLTIPPGVTFTIPILLLHHDRELWGDDADAFNPARFSEGVSKATRNRSIYFPFGMGPRICMGQSFAWIETRMALAMILQNFSFELSANYVHAPFTVVTLQPQHGAQVILHKIEIPYDISENKVLTSLVH